MNPTSDQQRFSYTLILVLALLQMVFLTAIGFYNYAEHRDRLYQELEDSISQVEMRLRDKLPVFLWNFDDTPIRSSLSSEMHDPQINAVLIHVDNQLAYFLSRNNGEVVESTPVNANHFGQRLSQLHYTGGDGSATVGQLEIYYSDHVVKANLADWASEEIETLIFVTLFFTLALWLVFRLIFSRSIRSLMMASQTLNNISEAFVYVDSAQRITEINPSGLKLLAMDSLPDHECRLSDFFDLDPSQSNAISEAITAQRDWQGQGYCRPMLGGARLPVYINFNSVRDEAGQLVSYVLIFHDLTLQLEQERELRQALEEARVASQAKSQFLANMSHEIRTPMNGVIGAATLLKDTRLDSEQSQYLKIIHDAGTGLLSLINDILDFSRLDANKFELVNQRFDLQAVFESAMDTFSPVSLQKPINLLVHYHDDCPRNFEGDKNRIRQILINLLGNAVKFTARGDIHLSATCQEISTDQATIQIEVVDQGIGIPEEKIDSLFDEFVQVDMNSTREYEGSGLGLAITRRLVDVMGGRISISSKLQQGTRFTISLPLKLVDEPISGISSSSGRAQTDNDPTRFKGHVLVAEDVLPNQIVTRKMLEKMGVQVSLVDDGLKTLTFWQSNQCDLIFMDCRMPVMDGYQATLEIRRIELEENRPRTPIIALTANASPADREHCLEVGMDDLIAKPFRPDELADALRAFLPKQSEVKIANG